MDYQEAIEYFKNKLNTGVSRNRRRYYETAISAMQELEEYKELEKTGKLIKTPCAIGDTVYEIIHDDITTHIDYICKYTVEDISANAINFGGDWNPLDSSPNVYFTREEAEEALMKLKGEAACQKKRPAEPA